MKTHARTPTAQTEPQRTGRAEPPGRTLQTLQRLADTSPPTKRSAALQRQAVAQRTVSWDGKADVRDRYKPAKNDKITSPIYKAQFEKVNALPHPVAIFEDKDKTPGEGDYQSAPMPVGSKITLHPLVGDADEENPNFVTNLATLAHEFQHALDDLSDDRIDAFNLPDDATGRAKRVNIMHTEYRAWAVQAAANYAFTKQATELSKVNLHQQGMLQTYLDPSLLRHDDNHFIRKTQTYLKKHVHKGTTITITEQEARDFIEGDGAKWWGESLASFRALTGVAEPQAVEAQETQAEQTAPTAIETETEARALPGLSTAGSNIEKVRRGDTHNIYRFNGELYSVNKKLLDTGFFDAASGSWATD